MRNDDCFIFKGTYFHFVCMILISLNIELTSFLYLQPISIDLRVFIWFPTISFGFDSLPDNLST